MIQGNWIGTDVTGTGRPRQLLHRGRNCRRCSNVTVGGIGARRGQRHRFQRTLPASSWCYSGGSGTRQNPIRGNSIYSQPTAIPPASPPARASISTGGSGGRFTPNDLGDADTGGNDRQNFPVITSARLRPGGSTTIQGKLNSLPNTTFAHRLLRESSCAWAGRRDSERARPILGAIARHDRRRRQRDDQRRAPGDDRRRRPPSRPRPPTPTAIRPSSRSGSCSPRSRLGRHRRGRNADRCSRGSTFSRAPTVTVGSTSGRPSVVVASYNQITATTPSLASGQSQRTSP